ncbi:Grixazone synthase [Rhypophila decipiens]|uniref:Grixazone synthase n=1 Tax=Rhypophila decipiens TaxID=261697 RepID=A0AAN6XWX0_9PEZI|nr:Grixazone synthase [Rhypophila decipiens]
MKLLTLVWQLLAVSSLVSAVPAGPGKDRELEAAKQLKSFQKEYIKNVEKIVKKRKTGCTSKKILRRKEWGSLKKPERQAYINAIKCINKLTPPLTPPSLIPGVRTRLDDFIGSHQLRTPFVHSNGVFLSYHRHLVHLFEKALRTECGYTGAQPYWDWTLSWQDLEASPVFDGSATSLSGDGVFIPNRTDTVIPLPDGNILILTPGTGGGCVTTGPFQYNNGAGYVLNLGPQGSLDYNPRCLERDLHTVEQGPNTKPSKVAVLYTCGGDMACFYKKLDNPIWGVHSVGHYQLGATAGDVFVSPGDPAFWLHHANLDRVWAVWQYLGQGEERVKKLYGTVTNFNDPPSQNATLDFSLDFGGVISPARTLDEIISPIDGEHCFIYE